MKNTALISEMKKMQTGITIIFPITIFISGFLLKNIPLSAAFFFFLVVWQIFYNNLMSNVIEINAFISGHRHIIGAKNITRLLTLKSSDCFKVGTIIEKNKNSLEILCAKNIILKENFCNVNM
jgi:hypothetical protein